MTSVDRSGLGFHPRRDQDGWLMVVIISVDGDLGQEQWDLLRWICGCSKVLRVAWTEFGDYMLLVLRVIGGVCGAAVGEVAPEGGRSLVGDVVVGRGYQSCRGEAKTGKTPSTLRSTKKGEISLESR